MPNPDNQSPQDKKHTIRYAAQHIGDFGNQNSTTRSPLYVDFASRNQSHIQRIICELSDSGGPIQARRKFLLQMLRRRHPVNSSRTYLSVPHLIARTTRARDCGDVDGDGTRRNLDKGVIIMEEY